MLHFSRMRLLLLSGNNVSNEAWIDLVANVLKTDFDVHVHRYRHWRTGDRYIDLEHELEAIEALTADWDTYGVFAKSAGTLLTMKGAFEGRLYPKKCVFVGVPIPWGIENDRYDHAWLDAFGVPTRFIQQEFDRFLHAADLRNLLDAHNHAGAELITVPGSSHEYEDVKGVAGHAKRFLQKG